MTQFSPQKTKQTEKYPKDKIKQKIHYTCKYFIDFVDLIVSAFPFLLLLSLLSFLFQGGECRILASDKISNKI